MGPIVGYALLLTLAAAVQMVIRIVSRLVLFGAGRDIEYDIRNELLAHLQTLPPSYYAEQSTGDIISRASNDIGNIRLLYGPAVLNVVNTGFTLVSALVMMLIIDVRLTLLALLPLPFTILVIRKIAGTMSKMFFEVQRHLGVLSGQIQEVFSGIAVVKSFAREDWARASMARLNQDNFRRNVDLAKSRGLMLPMMGAVGGLGTFVILLFGGYAVIDGRISLGDFVAFNSYLAMLVWPMLALGWVYTMLQRGIAAAARVRQVLEIQPAIQVVEPCVQLPTGNGAIRFGDVRSVHKVRDGEPRVALDDVTLDIPAQGFIGLTGPVGSGKTTLLRLLLRLQDFDRGSVQIDGVDIRHIPLAELRGAIGYVPQEPYLFSASIAENIAFGRPGLSREDIERYATLAGLAKDIAWLPRGYDTVVGERGVTLSGGQRQRVALARALAREPRILLLDDALSAVDAETEEEILGSLQAFLVQRTSLVATHRLAGIRRAQQIVVLDHGRIVETGTHETLLAARGLYHRLCARQQLTRQLEETR